MILRIISSMITDMYVFVPYYLIMTFYDVSAMIHLAMVSMLSSKRIIVGTAGIGASFVLHWGKEWSTIVAIVYTSSQMLRST